MMMMMMMMMSRRRRRRRRRTMKAKCMTPCSGGGRRRRCWRFLLSWSSAPEHVLETCIVSRRSRRTKMKMMAMRRRHVLEGGRELLVVRGQGSLPTFADETTALKEMNREFVDWER
eukprot:178515-Hanusia_phi.AAC.2